MARELLLPGFGSRKELTVSVTENEAAAPSDELDMSRCAQFGVQVKTWDSEAELTLQVQHTLDGTNWANLGDAQVVVEGDILRFPAISGPFGVIRLAFSSEVSDASSSSSHADDSVVAVVVGYPMQWSN